MRHPHKSRTPGGTGAAVKKSEKENIEFFPSEPQVRNGQVTVWRRPRRFYECRGAR
jgi:hypothetical protein